jgi:hypothetical protein
MRRFAIIAGILSLAAGLSIIGFAIAGADTATLQFDDSAQLVELSIPTPACVADGCQWQLQVDNPATNQVFGSASSGEAGSIITVPYPSDFCGIIQADVFVLDNETGAPHLQFGHRHEVNTCQTPTTTTTIGCPPDNRPASAGCPVTTTPTTVTSVISSPPPTPSSPPTSSTVVTPSNPNQLPPIPPAQNGVTQGRG